MSILDMAKRKNSVPAKNFILQGETKLETEFLHIVRSLETDRLQLDAFKNIWKAYSVGQKIEADLISVLLHKWAKEFANRIATESSSAWKEQCSRKSLLSNESQQENVIAPVLVNGADYIAMRDEALVSNNTTKIDSLLSEMTDVFSQDFLEKLVHNVLFSTNQINYSQIPYMIEIVTSVREWTESEYYNHFLHSITSPIQRRKIKLVIEAAFFLITSNITKDKNDKSITIVLPDDKKEWLLEKERILRSLIGQKAFSTNNQNIYDLALQKISKLSIVEKEETPEFLYKEKIEEHKINTHKPYLPEKKLAKTTAVEVIETKVEPVIPQKSLPSPFYTKDFLSHISDKETWELRPYQFEWLYKSIDKMEQWIWKKYEWQDPYETAILLDMIMSTGKTVVVGKLLSLLTLPEVTERLWTSKRTMLLISDKIETNNNQHKSLFDDATIIPATIREKFSHTRVHHQSNDELHIDEIRNCDLLFVSSTFHSLEKAKIKEIIRARGWFDVIWVDETHHLDADSWRKLFEDCNQINSRWYKPLNIFTTGTVSAKLWELVKPTFTYSLSEYLLSPYSPNVNYTMVTNIDTTEEKLLEIRDAVFSFTNDPTRHTPRRYKKASNQIQSMIQSILPNFVDQRAMVDDVLFRAGWDLKHSIYFVDTKTDAEDLAVVLREKSPFSVKTFYSGKDNTNVLDDFGEWLIDQLVVIGKLDESVHPPHVKHLWWMSKNKSWIRILQRLWRFLDSDDDVRAWDYSGSFHYLAEMLQISTDMDKRLITDTSDIKRQATWKKKGTRPMWNIAISNANITMADMTSTSEQDKLRIYIPFAHLFTESSNSSRTANTLFNNDIAGILSSKPRLAATVTTEQLLAYIDSGEITWNDLERSNRPKKAKYLNGKYADEWISFPMDRYEMIQHLWWDPETSLSSAYLRSLLYDTPYNSIEKPAADINDIAQYYAQGLITDEMLLDFWEWMNFALSNNHSPTRACVVYYDIWAMRIKFLGKGKTKEDLLAFVKELSSNILLWKRLATKADYINAWKQWDIKIDDLSPEKWSLKAQEYNKQSTISVLFHTDRSAFIQHFDVPHADTIAYQLTCPPELKIGTGKQFSDAYNAGYFYFDICDKTQYQTHAVERNKEHASQYWFFLPMWFSSFESVMRCVNNPKKLKEMLIGPFREAARKNDIIELIKEWVITSDWFKERTWKKNAEEFNTWDSHTKWLILQKKLRTIATTLLGIWSTQSIDLGKFSVWYPDIIPHLVSWDATKTAEMVRQLRDDVTSVIRSADIDTYNTLLDSWVITYDWFSSTAQRTLCAKRYMSTTDTWDYCLHTTIEWFIRTMLSIPQSQKFNMQDAYDIIATRFIEGKYVNPISDTIEKQRESLLGSYISVCKLDDYHKLIVDWVITPERVDDRENKSEEYNVGKNMTVAKSIRALFVSILKLWKIDFNMSDLKIVVKEYISMIASNTVIPEEKYEQRKTYLEDQNTDFAKESDYENLIAEWVITYDWLFLETWREKAQDRNATYSKQRKFTISGNFMKVGHLCKPKDVDIEIGDITAALAKQYVSAKMIHVSSTTPLQSLWVLSPAQLEQLFVTSINFDKQKIDKTKANHAAEVFKWEKALVVKKLEGYIQSHDNPADFYENFHTRLIRHSIQKVTLEKLQEMFAHTTEPSSSLYKKEYIITLMSMYDRYLNQKKESLTRGDRILLFEQKKELPIWYWRENIYEVTTAFIAKTPDTCSKAIHVLEEMVRFVM